jgi:hypothetical protein
MHIARAIEQDIHRPGGLGGGGNGRIIQHILWRGGKARGGECREQRWVSVCCHHARAFGGHGQRRGPADALACGRHETKLTRQSTGHVASPPKSMGAARPNRSYALVARPITIRKIGSKGASLSTKARTSRKCD